MKKTDNKNSILAVVVTYNRKNMLIKCIDHILNQKGVSCDILIVDNASTDGTINCVKNITDTRVNYLNTGSNIGGAGGFNAGLKEAVKRGYEYVWVMDDDCLPFEDALENLWKYHNQLKGEYGWLSSVALWNDGSICTMNVQKISLTEKVSDYSDELIDAEYASFVSLFMPTKHIKTYGLPIKEFFIWSDDLEYTRRISAYEYCYVVPSSKVTHAMEMQSAGGNIATLPTERLGRCRYSYRNDVYLFRREGVKGWVWLIARNCYHTYQVITGKCERKMQRIKIIWNGFKEGLHFKPEVEFVE